MLGSGMTASPVVIQDGPDGVADGIDAPASQRQAHVQVIRKRLSVGLVDIGQRGAAV